MQYNKYNNLIKDFHKQYMESNLLIAISQLSTQI